MKPTACSHGIFEGFRNDCIFLAQAGQASRFRQALATSLFPSVGEVMWRVLQASLLMEQMSVCGRVVGE